MLNCILSIADSLTFKKRGTLKLFNGCPKEIFIKTEWTPKKVWMEISDVHGVPLCHAEPDGFDYRIVPGGFVLYVTLNSKERIVEWLAKK